MSDPDFTAFVTARQAALLRFATVLTGERALAQDLVQDAFVTAHPRWADIRAMAAPEAYLKKMIVNGHLSFRRKWSRVRLVDEVDEVAAGPVSGDAVGQIDDRHLLADELRKLPRQQRAVLVLRYYEGLSDPEIAEVLHCSAGTVRGYASRALATIRIELGAERQLDDSPYPAVRKDV